MHLTHLNRLPYLAPYISMFNHAVQRVLIIIGVFASLFMAFVLGFCVLFPNHKMFQDIPVAALKLFLMAVNDQHYSTIFNANLNDSMTSPLDEGVEPEEQRLMHLDYSLPTQLFYIAFIVVFGILMLNVLIGLAASDVHKIREDATLLRAERQIIEIARLETFLATSWFCISSCTRNTFLALMAVEYRNGRTFNFAPTDPDAETSLPKRLKAKFIPYLATRPCYRSSSGSGKLRNLEIHTQPELTHSRSFTGGRSRSRSSDTIESILADLRRKLEGLTSGTGTIQRRSAGQRQSQNQQNTMS